MSILTDISENLQKGKAKVVKQLVQQAIDEKIPVDQILNEGLLSGMSVIGEKFKNNEVFVPEVLVAARAMNMGASLLKPLMAEAGVQATGKVCIGTVRGDLHDIGKNLVKMMMEGKGLEVIDPGHGRGPRNLCTDGTRSGMPDHLLLGSAHHHHVRNGKRCEEAGRSRRTRQDQGDGRRRSRYTGVLRSDRRRLLYLRCRQRRRCCCGNLQGFGLTGGLCAYEAKYEAVAKRAL